MESSYMPPLVQKNLHEHEDKYGVTIPGEIATFIFQYYRDTDLDNFEFVPLSFKSDTGAIIYDDARGKYLSAHTHMIKARDKKCAETHTLKTFSTKLHSLYSPKQAVDVIFAHCFNGDILVLDSNNLSIKNTLKSRLEHFQPFTCMAYSTAYKVLVAGDQNHKVLFWRLDENFNAVGFSKAPWRKKGYTSIGCTGLAFYNDQIFVSRFQKRIEVFDVKNFHKTHQLDLGNHEDIKEIRNMALDRLRGQLIISTDKQLLLWDINEKKIKKSVSNAKDTFFHVKYNEEKDIIFLYSYRLFCPYQSTISVLQPGTLKFIKMNIFRHEYNSERDAMDNTILHLLYDSDTSTFVTTTANDHIYHNNYFFRF